MHYSSRTKSKSRALSRVYVVAEGRSESRRLIKIKSPASKQVAYLVLLWVDCQFLLHS